MVARLSAHALAEKECLKSSYEYLFTGVTGPRGMRGFSLRPGFCLDDLRVMPGLITFGNRPGAALVLPRAALGFLPLTRRKRGPLMAFLWILPIILLTLFGHFTHNNAPSEAFLRGRRVW